MSGRPGHSVFRELNPSARPVFVLNAALLAVWSAAAMGYVVAHLTCGKLDDLTYELFIAKLR